MLNTPIRKATVDLIAKLLRPLADAGILSIPEEKEIVAQLRNLAKTGNPLPVVIPKLIGQPEAATMLGISLANFKKMERNGAFRISLANFKKMERNGAFPFSRKKIGTSVRYRNTDIVRYILADPDSQVNS